MAGSKKDKKTRKRKKEKNAERQDDAEILRGGAKKVINDSENGSKAFFPIHVDKGYEVKLERTDQGIMEDRQENMPACDFFLDARSSSHDAQNINCFLELKGTNNPDKVDYAEKQILTTIKDHEISGDFVFAVISGAKDKTLPKMNSSSQKEICMKLKKLCKKRLEVTNMDNLLIYVEPTRQYKDKEAKIKDNSAPTTIMCWDSNNSFIPFPSTFIKLIK